MSFKIQEGSIKTVLIISLISIVIFLNTGLFSKERKFEMGIVLVAVGEVDRNIMDWLKNDLNKVFYKQVSIGKGMPDPDYAYHKKRDPEA